MTPTAPDDEYRELLSTRETFYRSLGDRWIDLAEPQANKAYAAYSREIVHVPLGVTAGSAVLWGAAETIGTWAVVPAAVAGLAVMFTGQRAKLALRSPGAAGSLPADVAQAHDDFRAALATLPSPRTPVDVLMAVRGLEPGLEAAMRTVFDPAVEKGAAIRATETVLTIGARAWALARLEERRTQAIEAVVGTDVETDLPGWDAAPLAPDFAEIDAVAARISEETQDLTTIVDDQDERR